MLGKWIVCKVWKDQEKSFSLAQEEWRDLKNVPGFIGQIGGWNQLDRQEACILGLWKNENSYENFMNNFHDSITDSNHQMAMVEKISTSIFQKKLDIPGKFSSIEKAFHEGNLIRVADCQVKIGQESHFERIQKEIWNVGMGREKGMIGGVFWSSSKKTSHYLVTTLWSGEEAHQKYKKGRFSKLRKEAKVEEDISKLKGYFVKLENSWTVINS